MSEPHEHCFVAPSAHPKTRTSKHRPRPYGASYAICTVCDSVQDTFQDHSARLEGARELRWATRIYEPLAIRAFIDGQSVDELVEAFEKGPTRVQSELRHRVADEQLEEVLARLEALPSTSMLQIAIKDLHERFRRYANALERQRKAGTPEGRLKAAFNEFMRDVGDRSQERRTRVLNQLLAALTTEAHLWERAQQWLLGNLRFSGLRPAILAVIERDLSNRGWTRAVDLPGKVATFTLGSAICMQLDTEGGVTLRSEAAEEESFNTLGEALEGAMVIARAGSTPFR